MDYVLTCCSTSDMDMDFYKRRNIQYICFHYLLDGNEYDDDFGKSLSFKEFYQLMKNGKKPMTSQVNYNEFVDFFENILKEGKDILHVCLSSGLSGVYNSARTAASYLKERYPDRKIYVLDSLGASSGYGLLMDYIADKRDEGYTIDEAYDWALENRLNIHHWFFSTDLSSYKRGGRISPTACMFGTLLGICPLLNMDSYGRLVPREKIRPKNRVIKEIVGKMVENAISGTNYDGKCAICHSDSIEGAKAVRDLVVSKMPQLQDKIEIYSIGTVIGSHTGPGTVALFFMGNKRED